MSDTSIGARSGTLGAVLDDPQVSDYWELLKPRVMSLVVFSGFAGLFVAPGHLNPVLAAIAVLCIAVGSGAAGAINMWYDRDIDAVMARTSGRPIPAGRVQPGVLRDTTVVRAVYSGPYEGLGEAWGQFAAWMRDNGHTGAPDIWEQYVAGPESSPDPSHSRLSSSMIRLP